MKNIKYGLIALTALVAGTGSAFAVSASTESTSAISISAEPITIEDAAELTKTEHRGNHNPRRYARCSRCTYYGTSASGTLRLGHCKRSGRVHHCQKRI